MTTSALPTRGRTSPPRKGRQSRPRQATRPRRTRQRPAQNLAHPAQTPLLPVAGRAARQSHPRPSSPRDYPHHLIWPSGPGLICGTLDSPGWRDGGAMTGGGVQEIVAGIWCWQRRPRGLRPGEFGTRTSYALTVNDETLFIDPLVEGDDDPALGALDNLAGGRVRILISKPFHTRSAEPLWRRYRRAQARIYGHPEVATRLGDTSGFQAVTGGTDVGGVARFHPIGSPPRSEQPIEISAQQVHAIRADGRLSPPRCLQVEEIRPRRA